MWGRWLARLIPRAPWAWRLLLIAGAVAPLLVAVASAWARPGGGESFSGGDWGGGGGGGGGGGDGDGGGAEAVFLLIRLIIEVPEIGIPVTVIVAVIWIYGKRSRKVVAAASYTFAVPPPQRQRADLDAIRAVDEEFSTVLFEDFVYRLYAQAQEARASAERMAALAPYLEPLVRDALLRREPHGVPVSNVCIGSLTAVAVHVPVSGPTDLAQATAGVAAAPSGMVIVTVDLECNLTAGRPGEQVTYYVRDRWTLHRDVSVRSRAPTGTRRFPCPSCGAPFQSSDGQTCAYCGQVVGNGRFDWAVSLTQLRSADQVAPALTGTVAERGTDLPTYRHPQLGARMNELLADDPQANTWRARLELIYGALNRAWTEMDLSIARPYVSDGLFDYLRYWIEAYQRQGLRNVLEEMTIVRVDPARLIRDKHFDALTVRVFGTGRDYTVNQQSGSVVAGSRSSMRDYSEYWTLIRGSRVRGAARTTPTCANCGAELAISMAGTCTHCEAHITSGEFDWVLSRIEQDDSYRG